MNALTSRAAAGDPRAASLMEQVNTANNIQIANKALAGNEAARSELQQRALAGDPSARRFNQQLQERENQLLLAQDSRKLPPPPKNTVAAEAPKASMPMATEAPKATMRMSANKTPTVQNMAKQIDDRNQAAEIAAEKARQRAAKAGGGGGGGGAPQDKPKPMQQPPMPRGGGGGGGGGRPTGRAQQPMTAKMRNDQAAATAAKKAERADRGMRSDQDYRDAFVRSAASNQSAGDQNRSFEKQGLNPGYTGWNNKGDNKAAYSNAVKRGEHNAAARATAPQRGARPVSNTPNANPSTPQPKTFSVAPQVQPMTGPAPISSSPPRSTSSTPTGPAPISSLTSGSGSSNKTRHTKSHRNWDKNPPLTDGEVILYNRDKQLEKGEEPNWNFPTYDKSGNEVSQTSSGTFRKIDGRTVKIA